MSQNPHAGRLRLLASGLAIGCLAVAAVTAVAGPVGAAVPDRYGFVLWNGAVVGTGTTPAASTVAVIGVGQYKIDFVGQAAAGGVAHVTAINTVPHWCQINAFGPSGADEIVAVSCHKVGGALDPTAFSAIFDSSTGPVGPGSFGYVNSTAGGGLISQYNSSGAGNAVVHAGAGQWTVNFPGVASPGPMDGSLQATAVSQPGVPMRCKILSWASGGAGQTVKVNCYNAGGVLTDTQFTLTYQYLRALYGGFAPPKYFGYLWNQPVGGPVSTNYNNPAGPGANVLTPGVLATVQFPLLAVLPDDIQVTAYGSGPNFCGLTNPWTHSGTTTIARDVNCFTNAGAGVASGFFISDNSTM
jgi:hypothetical protein